MPYVDGFVIPLPKKNLRAYRSMAQKAGVVWREHGALDYRECVADDADQAKNLATFRRNVDLKRNEVPVFSWIVYKSRAHRDRVNAKAMKDPRIVEMMRAKDMPFDAKRMSYCGFNVIVDITDAGATSRPGRRGKPAVSKRAASRKSAPVSKRAASRRSAPARKSAAARRPAATRQPAAPTQSAAAGGVSTVRAAQPPAGEATSA